MIFVCSVTSKIPLALQLITSTEYQWQPILATANNNYDKSDDYSLFSFYDELFL
jgi:hypothetical protein